MSDWRILAACRGLGPSLFYPDGYFDQAVTHAARRVCAVCPVTAECLDDAIAHGELYGIWGGTSPRWRQTRRRVLHLDGRQRVTP